MAPQIFTHLATAKEKVSTWIQNPEVLVERKVVICIVMYCCATFSQFHTMRFLFSWRIPGMTLKRQKVQKEVFFQSLFWIMALVMLLITLPSYYGALMLYEDYIKPDFAYRQNPSTFLRGAVKCFALGWIELFKQTPRLLFAAGTWGAVKFLGIGAFILRYSFLQVFRWNK